MRACIAIAAAFLLFGCLAEAGNITVPSGEFRSVELRDGVDADAWATKNGVPVFERIASMGGGDILRFDMQEGVWRARRQALCTDPDVAACSTDYCQSYFSGHAETFGTTAGAPDDRFRDEPTFGVTRAPRADRFTGLAMDASGRPVAGARTYLVRRAPEIAVLVEQIEATRSEQEQADDDERIRLNFDRNASGQKNAAELKSAAGVDAPANIDPQTATGSPEAASDDSQLTDSSAIAAIAAPGLDALVISPEDAMPGARRCDASPSGQSGVISAVTGSSGGFSLEAPAAYDRGCWEILTASACEMRRQPVNEQLPEFEPRKVLALVSLEADAAGLGLVDTAQSIAADAGLRLLEASALASIDRGLLRLQIDDPGLDELAALRKLRLDPRVEQSQLEQRYRTSQSAADSLPAVLPAAPETPAGPNDPFAFLNYGALSTGAGRLHDRLTGAGVTVAVIDTGVDAAHPELQGRVVEQIDVSGFGWSADQHGTAVAGIIGAARDNALGAYGMAPQVKLLAIKACQPEYDNSLGARCWTSTLAKALDAALLRDARIINLSLGGPNDVLLEELINKALDENHLLFGAAGNGGPDAQPTFPASHPGVVAVTAIDSRDQLYSGATRGLFVDLAAPGVEIVVAVPGQTYPGSLSGTSMATAHASGAAALLLEASPEAAVAELRAALENTAVDLGELARDAQFGRGRIDSCAAVRSLVDDESLCPGQAQPTEIDDLATPDTDLVGELVQPDASTGVLP